MNRRELLRNALLTIAAATVNWQANARVFAPGYDASAELARADWKPAFFDAHQNETLIDLSDAIIPTTDTPGAKAALVNRFLDLLMASESPSVQHEFLSSLTYLDAGSREQYKRDFLDLSSEERNVFLSLLAFPRPRFSWDEPDAALIGYEHFSKLKAWISGAFYSSPIGLKEMGWDGSIPHGIFTGCDHQSGDHAKTE
jgi:hypothetical protein